MQVIRHDRFAHCPTCYGDSGSNYTRTSKRRAKSPLRFWKTQALKSSLERRPAIASTLIALQPGWPSQPSFSAELAARLAADLAALVDAGTAPDVAACRRFLGFSSSIAATCRVSAQALGGMFSGENLRPAQVLYTARIIHCLLAMTAGAPPLEIPRTALYNVHVEGSLPPHKLFMYVTQ